MRRLTLFFAAVLAATAAACSHDSPAAVPTTPTPTGTSPSGQNIAFDSGTVDQDTLPVATALPVKLHVTQAGVGVSGVAVTWAVSNGHGTVSSASTTTDASGAASVTWTLGDTVGINTISAAITGASVTLNKLSLAGPVSSLVKVSPDSNRVVAGATLPLISRVVDRFGNAVKGATVTWSASSGAVSTTSVTTGSSGNAGTNFTTASAPGSYTVTATLPGKAAVSFKVVGF